MRSRLVTWPGQEMNLADSTLDAIIDGAIDTHTLDEWMVLIEGLTEKRKSIAQLKINRQTGNPQ